ncbi:uncharacterized protein LOC110250056 [Exaiptasia diaphana]|uniref:DDE Tnp4 domain-containing protein n=1 Tax=Exaiptasia diaphana TaxID=2652724 RepID=A0A913Y0W1_EXADI|nr:uncharacterized protein LOC110250056 [Exaiptasia diaphana]
MVATRHCCWGTCKSDSRYPERLPDSLKEMLKNGQKAFIPFPKPKHGLERCQRWINACSREHFTVKNINYNTYICALHWPGGKGPTDEFPDPFKANLTSQEMDRSRGKRKAPLRRSVKPVNKRSRKCIDSDRLEITESSYEDDSVNVTFEEDKSLDKSTQTTYTETELKSKIEAMVTANELKTKVENTVIYQVTAVSNISYDIVIKNSETMKHFTGLSSRQFNILFDFLNDVCPLDKLTYWSYCDQKKSVNKLTQTLPSKWSTKERLFICLLRLRRGFTIKTMSILLSTPDKQIKETSIRDVFTTYMQLMYRVFRDMSKVMFPSKEILQKCLPPVFKTIKRIRCSVDCTEFRVETARNFARQGNTYSSYKHANTFKCLIAVTPNGGSCFVSDLYEGDISDVQIFEQSGILKHIEPQDVILVDRGFTVQDLVNPLQAHINIPAFLKGRANLSAAEELSTRKIAKARVHVERFNQRLKQFKMVGRTIPLSLAPLATQMVVVACGLVNFQEVLCR